MLYSIVLRWPGLQKYACAFPVCELKATGGRQIFIYGPNMLKINTQIIIMSEV
jgi:hypothetical protein